MSEQREVRISDYGTAYRENYGFEQVLVESRRKIILELLDKILPRTVVEVGCGTELLLKQVLEKYSINSPIEQWVVVEANNEFAKSAEKADFPSGIFRVVNGFAEDSVEAILDQFKRGPDLVICSSLLHEVDNLTEIVIALSNMLSPGAYLHANVPNALSLHRQLAVSMGLTQSEKDLGERNKLLQQARIFTMEELIAILEERGFEIVETGGYFIKPFTHSQMDNIPFMNPELLDGLFQLGRKLPEIAAEIYVNARKL